MSLQSAAGDLRAHWITTAAHYDAVNAKLIDQSSFANDLPKLGGTPSFGTFGTFAGLDMPGDVYFGAPNDMLPAEFTLVAPAFIHGLPTGGAAGIDLFRAELRDTPVTDPAWQSPASNFGVGANSAKGVRIFAQGDFARTSGGSPQHNLDFTFTDNAWSVLQLVVDPDGGQFKFRLGSAAWQTWTATNGLLPGVWDEFRLGYRSAGNMGAAKFASSQFALYSGDVTGSAGYSALITALLADPTAT